MVDFVNQFNQSLRGGLALGNAFQQQAMNQQAMQTEQLRQQIQRNNLEREKRKDRNKQYVQYATMLASVEPKEQKELIVQMQQQMGKQDPVLSKALTQMYQMDDEKRDAALFGLIDSLGGEMKRRDKTLEEFTGVKGISFDDLPAEDKSAYIYASAGPEGRKIIEQRVNLRDQTPEQVRAIETAKKDAELTAENLSDKQNKLRGYVAQGISANSQITNIDRAIEIQKQLETGGIESARQSLRNYFGIEAPEAAGMAELNSLFADVVLGRLRSLGANPTEGERKFLTEAVGSVQQNRAANLAILQRARKEAQAQYQRGQQSYREILKETPGYKSTVFDSIYKLSAPQNPAGRKPQPAPVPSPTNTNRNPYGSIDDVANKYGGF